ncbi:hypothetical protein TorRG33x02_327220 [Trema orientale]|uniref:Uncharacterized protein n=1 Tax=Trema orientale TaxID=63057 RepID=A0A2P5BB46_TREOI|nr:hypothetical protein TorRG33x02_327220 [Trema orientale]
MVELRVPMPYRDPWKCENQRHPTLIHGYENVVTLLITLILYSNGKSYIYYTHKDHKRSNSDQPRCHQQFEFAKFIHFFHMECTNRIRQKETKFLMSISKLWAIQMNQEEIITMPYSIQDRLL